MSRNRQSHRKARQLSLFNQKPKRGRKPQKPADHFGGAHLIKYNPKSKRPMDSKKALHVVLRSTQATGTRSFKNAKNEKKIWIIIQAQAQRVGIALYSYANGGNHLHILLRAKHRDDYTNFIRSVCGLIARHVGRSEKGHPLKKKFWDARPFSRIVSFAHREFYAVKTYLLRNVLEAIGWMPYYSRKLRLPHDMQQILMAYCESG